MVSAVFEPNIPILCKNQIQPAHCIAIHRAISRKVVGKSPRDDPEGYSGWFRLHCSSKKLERRAWEATDLSLQVLKESNKSRFDSYRVRNSVLIIFHITVWDCPEHFFTTTFLETAVYYTCQTTLKFT